MSTEAIAPAEDDERRFKAFVAGWHQACEGWNGEYSRKTEEVNLHLLRKCFDYWVAGGDQTQGRANALDELEHSDVSMF
jgi:hypothetical protein